MWILLHESREDQDLPSCLTLSGISDSYALPSFLFVGHPNVYHALSGYICTVGSMLEVANFGGNLDNEKCDLGTEAVSDVSRLHSKCYSCSFV